MKWQEAITLHRTHLRAKRRAEKTLEWYGEQFEAFDRWRSVHGVGDGLPTPEEIDAFIADEHDRGLRPSTVHARFRAIRAVLNFLERRRKIEAGNNPIRACDAPSVPMEARRSPTVEQIETLLASISGETWLDARDRLIISIMAYSGLRVGEVCNLLVDDIDTRSHAVLVRSGKGWKARLVPTPPWIVDALLAYLDRRPSRSEHLFLASDGYAGVTGPLKREGVRQMLIRRCRAAGLEIFNPHAFRHAFAMWMLNAGARLTTVSAAMGHSDPAITSRIYAHTTTATVRAEYNEALARVTS